MKIDVISTSTENVIDNARATSSNHVGKGRIKNTSIKTMPKAKAMSDRFASMEKLWRMSAEVFEVGTGACAIDVIRYGL